MLKLTYHLEKTRWNRLRAVLIGINLNLKDDLIKILRVNPPQLISCALLNYHKRSLINYINFVIDQVIN